MIPPLGMGAFEFVAVAALRVAQLQRGCRPKVDGDHSTAVFARREVAEGKVTRTFDITPVAPEPDVEVSTAERFALRIVT